MPLVRSAFVAAATIVDAPSFPEDCLPPNTLASFWSCMRASGRFPSNCFTRGYAPRHRRSDSDEQLWQQIDPHQPWKILRDLSTEGARDEGRLAREASLLAAHSAGKPAAPRGRQVRDGGRH